MLERFVGGPLGGNEWRRERLAALPVGRLDSAGGATRAVARQAAFDLTGA